MLLQNDAASSFQIHPQISTSFQSPHPPCSHTPFSTASSQHQQPHQQHQPLPPHSTVITSAPQGSQLTLMQYSLPHPHSNAAIPPGYLAMPYASLQDLQLRMHQSMLPHVQLGSAGIPGMTVPESSLIGMNPGFQVMATAGIPLQQSQLAVAHSNAAVIQGPMGSWVTPVPVMNNCIINHPFQPDTMATPWVK